MVLLLARHTHFANYLGSTQSGITIKNQGYVFVSEQSERVTISGG